MNQLIKHLFPAFVIITNSGAQISNINDFGALADAKTLNTESIQNAIDACNNHGVGKVYVPAGTFDILLALFSSLKYYRFTM
jgi:polygalacturonase